jgi:hypothetical protein
MDETMKKCMKCKQEKLINEFSYDNKHKTYYARCNDCKGISSIPQDSLKCYRCNKIKLKIEFENIKKCKECDVIDKEAAKKRRINRKEKISRGEEISCNKCLKKIDENNCKIKNERNGKIEWFKMCKYCYDKFNKYTDKKNEEERNKKKNNTQYCRCCKKEKNNFSIHRNGKIFELCDDCRKKTREYAENETKCKHNIIKYRCKECNGSSLCVHNVKKSECKTCFENGVESCGGSFCPHDKRRDRCKICSIDNNIKKGIGSYCQHRRLWSFCSECKKSETFCQHNIRKNRCKECFYVGYLHNKYNSQIWKYIDNYLKEGKDVFNNILQITISEYIKYLESKFVYGMNWNNYGKSWHIDHIKPFKFNNKIPTEEELYERLVYTNTQPLWAFDNISKSNK